MRADIGIGIGIGIGIDIDIDIDIDNRPLRGLTSSSVLALVSA